MIRLTVIGGVALALWLPAVNVSAQIVDRPPAQPKAPLRWGVSVGYVPIWNTPPDWGRLFLGDIDPDRVGQVQFDGGDFRIGVVRARPLGFEWGLSYVRKTVKDNLRIPRQNYSSFGNDPNPVTYTGVESIEVTGLDSHVVIPAGRIGRRVQIGALLGGGFGIVPDEPVLKRIDGPPYYVQCQNFSGQTVPTPPASGGCVFDEFGNAHALAPGAQSAEVVDSFLNAWAMEDVWFFLRTQLAVDVMIAPPLKVRFAGGFNFPAAQYFGVDLVYLFNVK